MNMPCVYFPVYFAYLFYNPYLAQALFFLKKTKILFTFEKSIG